MKRLLALLAAGSLAAAAMTAQAAQYPPGPSGTCTDTLSIVELQTLPPLACSPAAGDTVWGVTGTVTGFDKDFGPFAFWIQLNTPGQWRGIQVFTGGTNYFNSVTDSPSGGSLRIGDEVVVYGRVLEFNGMTEFLDFDNSQTSNDIIVRRVATGSPVPDYYVGDVDQFNWVPGLATNAEPYEGMLVKLRGPLTVGRTAGPGVGSRSMLLADATFPGDTACVDGFSLTNIAALPVGTVIDSVQGIMTQVVIGGISSYRILMRGSSDIFGPIPPGLVDAYSIEDNLLRLVFDRDLDEASAENVANYSLASFGTVNSATLVGGAGNVVVLDITNGLTDGDPETVTASGILSSTGTPMAGAQNRSFANGVMRLSRVNYPSATGLAGAPCADQSQFVVAATGAAGTRVSYRGVCTSKFGALYFLADDGATPDSLRSAMPVYAPFQPLEIGKRYLLAGQVTEFNGINTAAKGGLTEGVNTVFIQDEGVAALPTPAVQTIAVLSDSSCDATQSAITGEDYEAMLVRLEYVRIVEDRLPGESFFVADLVAPDTMLISNQENAYTFDPESLHTVTVTGMLNYRTGTRAFRIIPRNNADIIDHGFNVGVGDGGTRRLSFAVYPNPAKSPQLSFTLPQSGNVEIAAYDVSGRKVADVFNGYLPAGQYSRAWNGSSSAGRLGAGLYFLRLRTAGKEMVARSVLLQ